jgi:hypothetical protein
MIAFVPESEEEIKAHEEIKALYNAQLNLINTQIAMLQDLIVQATAKGE